MAGMVLEVKNVTAQRDGPRITISVQGESANSRDDVYLEISVVGDTANVNVRSHPAAGMGTQMTGPFNVTGTIDGGGAVKTVKVHSRSGTKTITV